MRRALSLMIDRKLIVDRLLDGSGEPAGQMVPQGLVGWNPKLVPEPYDLDGAKKLLAEAGYPDPSKITIIVDSTPHAARPINGPVAQALALYWRNIGIDVKERTSDYANLMDQDNGNHDLIWSR